MLVLFQKKKDHTRCNMSKKLCNVLCMLDKILDYTNIDSILIKHRPFMYDHSDVDLVVKIQNYKRIVKELIKYGKLIKAERYKVHINIKEIEIELHMGIAWWNALLIPGDVLFNYVDSSSKVLYRVYNVDKLKRIHVLSREFDSFVLLLARLFQDFEINVFDMLHLSINDRIASVRVLFEEYGFSGLFVRMLFSFLHDACLVLRSDRKKRYVRLPFTLFLSAHFEFITRTRFYANVLSRIMLFARNLLWYIVLRIRDFLYGGVYAT